MPPKLKSAKTTAFDGRDGHDELVPFKKDDKIIPLSEPVKTKLLDGHKTAFTLDRVFFNKFLRANWKAEFSSNLPTMQARGSLIDEKDTKKENKDYDLFLGETLTPMLALALEQLTKVIVDRLNRRDTNPNLYFRFSPLKWVGQWLMRKKTNFIFNAKKENSFIDWVDFEKGRREMLRKRNAIQKVFSGFQKSGRLSIKDMPRVVSAIDESLALDGYLKHHEIIPDSWDVIVETEGYTNFNAFWKWFAKRVMNADLIRYSMLKKGEIKLAAELKKFQEMQDAKRAKEQEEQRKKEWKINFDKHLEGLSKDPELTKVLTNPDMLLTGDDDLGRPDEIKPQGEHVLKLRDFMDFLGFSAEDADSDDEEHVSKTSKDKEWESSRESWNKSAMKQWELWQIACKFELIDGVVDQTSLQKLLKIDPQMAQGLKKHMGELHNRRRASLKGDTMAMGELPPEEREPEGKPSLNDLSLLYGLTMARLEWLHHQFSSFLGEGVVDDYPNNPVGLTKSFMKTLMFDLLPNITDAAFDEAFAEIDLDGGGEIEFDEFVEWLAKEELGLEMPSDTSVPKPSFEQLAKRYNLPLERIMALYEQFTHFLPDGKTCNYPDDPGHLTQEEIRRLFKKFCPEVDDDEFLDKFEMVDFDGGGEIEFDEFLDFGWDDMDIENM